MKISDLVFNVSILSNIIYLGRMNKKETEFLEKEDVTSKVIASTIQFIGENKSKTITFGSGAKYKIKVEKLNDVKNENKLI